jgi:hypothetical protein
MMATQSAGVSKSSILEIMKCVCSDQRVGKRPRRLMSLFIENRMSALTTEQCIPAVGEENSSAKLAAVVRGINERFAPFGIKIHRIVEPQERWEIDLIGAR